MKKKIIVILAAVLAVVLIAAGIMYFNPTPARLIGRMAGNLDKVSSVEAEVSVEYEGSVNISVLGMPIVAPFALSTDLDVEAVTQPAVSHIEGTVSGSVYGVSMDTPLECYAQEEDGASTVYMSADHVHWLKHKAKDTDQEDPSFELDSKAVLGLMHKIASGEIETTLAEETETICGREAYRINIGISGDILQQILEIIYSSGNPASIPEGLDLSDADTECELYIYKKEKLPARITIDCAPLGNAVMQSLLEKQDYLGATDKFTVTATFTQYNAIERIERPEEVISGAVESDESLIGSLIPGL